jgi:integrase/recombinase XerC
MGKPWYRASKGTWYATIGGKKVSLRVQGRKNRAEAIRVWHELLANGRPDTTVPKADPIAAQVIGEFLADCEARLKPATVRGYRDFLTPFQRHCCNMPASAVTPEHAEAYSRKPTWSGSTRHDFLSILSIAFRWAERTGRVACNPLRHLRKPPMQSRGDKALITADEHAHLSEAAPRHFLPFLRLLHATGARPGEIASITADNFDAANAIIRLRDHKTARHGKRRVIFLPAEAVAILNEQKAKYGSGHLLRGRFGVPYTKNAVVHMFARLRKRTGIKNATAYGYRHSFATDALASGVPDAHVAELMGHSGTAMLHRHYGHLSSRAGVLRTALKIVR